MEPDFSLITYFQAGGPLMWVLLGGSILALAVILERSIVYLRYGLQSDRWLDSLLEDLRSGRTDAALSRSHACRHPIARVTETYLENLARPAKARLDNVKRTAALTLEHVEKRLRVLAAIAHLAPLVGLLGTVIGMVVAFAQIQALEGTVKPADLAGGIWEALLTTVFGLIVAIPAMAAFHAFESHADKIAGRMELAVTALDDIFAPDQPRLEEMTTSQPTVPAEDWSTVA
ncbi:MAG: MotA/TolQ/ExbB proton channel family protein [Chthoniobacterales bacterium]